jgi:hypothetical protein
VVDVLAARSGDVPIAFRREGAGHCFRLEIIHRHLSHLEDEVAVEAGPPVGNGLGAGAVDALLTLVDPAGSGSPSSWRRLVPSYRREWSFRSTSPPRIRERFSGPAGWDRVAGSMSDE